MFTPWPNPKPYYKNKNAILLFGAWKMLHIHLRGTEASHECYLTAFCSLYHSTVQHHRDTSDNNKQRCAQHSFIFISAVGIIHIIRYECEQKNTWFSHCLYLLFCHISTYFMCSFLQVCTFLFTVLMWSIASAAFVCEWWVLFQRDISVTVVLSYSG